MTHIIALLLQYKYAILFPLGIVEGPIITVIAGLFVRTGVLNFYWVYGVVVLGDALGDAIAYSVGRFGGPLVMKKFGKFFGVTPEKIHQAKLYFTNNRRKALFLSKIIHGVGIAGLMTAGSLKIPYKRFFMICITVSLVQSAVFLIVGILFGHAYALIGNYFNLFSQATIVVGLVIALIVFFWLRIRKK